jgi:hypothetical protein
MMAPAVALPNSTHANKLTRMLPSPDPPYILRAILGVLDVCQRLLQYYRQAPNLEQFTRQRKALWI